MAGNDILGNLLRDVGAPAAGLIVKNILPGTAGDIGGALAGKIVGSLAEALGAEPTADSVADAIQRDPAAGAAAAKKVEAENAGAISSELEERLRDTQDARATMLQLVDKGSAAQYGAPIVSVLVVIAFLTVVAVFSLRPIALNDAQATLLNILIGSLVAGFTQVLNYWLGSSAGSARSGEAIRKIAAAATSPGQIVGKVVDAAVSATRKR